ncbi:hypothetical protein I302_103950 [Kwoniella bestiolae CBS 10118]|uniref:BTB domain-containing protein n=1 Tax=Kwoniella bestiolae CBS 10118 TaxID=1296100 RepID=A0A1B9G9W8_9TREE|nr:hypothetical protein I302_02656 [Kwoniella bestiolae CBS 10118]OCF27807.1 hypothetical protein I302_02656 [Kwoniella bestiolae CBS 10118]
MPCGNASEHTAKPGPTIRQTTDGKNLHLFHRYGDIKLISKDGTILMADSKRLSDLSWEMGEEVGKAYSNDMEINMDRWSSTAISCFLDLINVETPRDPIADLPVLFELATLYYNYGDDGEIVTLIQDSIAKTATLKGRQWSLLKFANDFPDGSDLVLGKLALRSMSRKAFLSLRS